MKNIKIVALLVFSFSLSQAAFSQGEECQKKMSPMIKEYEKQLASNPDLTRADAEAMLQELMVTAKSKFPECFPDNYEEIKEENDRKSAEEDRVIEVKAEKDLSKVKPPNVAKPTPVKLPSQDPSITQNPKYQELKKDCTVILKEQLKNMKKELDIARSKARTGIERKQVMEGYSKLRREVLHACIMEKIEDAKN